MDIDKFFRDLRVAIALPILLSPKSVILPVVLNSKVLTPGIYEIESESFMYNSSYILYKNSLIVFILGNF